MRELDAGGVRVESHGIAHRPLAEVSLDEAVREIAVSKLDAGGAARPAGARLRLRQGLGGALPAGAREHRSSRPGYEIAFTSISGSNSAGDDPFRLRRYNVEPYPSRTFELVLARRVRPDRAQGHRRRHARPAPVQPGARHVDAVTVTGRATTPPVAAATSRSWRRVWGDRRCGRARSSGSTRQPGAAGIDAARRGRRARSPGRVAFASAWRSAGGARSAPCRCAS